MTNQVMSSEEASNVTDVATSERSFQVKGIVEPVPESRIQGEIFAPYPVACGAHATLIEAGAKVLDSRQLKALQQATNVTFERADKDAPVSVTCRLPNGTDYSFTVTQDPLHAFTGKVEVLLVAGPKMAGKAHSIAQQNRAVLANILRAIGKTTETVKTAGGNYTLEGAVFTVGLARGCLRITAYRPGFVQAAFSADWGAKSAPLPDSDDMLAYVTERTTSAFTTQLPGRESVAGLVFDLAAFPA